MIKNGWNNKQNIKSKGNNNSYTRFVLNFNLFVYLFIPFLPGSLLSIFFYGSESLAINYRINRSYSGQRAGIVEKKYVWKVRRGRNKC